MLTRANRVAEAVALGFYFFTFYDKLAFLCLFYDVFPIIFHVVFCEKFFILELLCSTDEMKFNENFLISLFPFLLSLHSVIFTKPNMFISDANEFLIKTQTHVRPIIITSSN